jgi:hypothetical protein
MNLNHYKDLKTRSFLQAKPSSPFQRSITSIQMDDDHFPLWHPGLQQPGFHQVFEIAVGIKYGYGQ